MHRILRNHTAHACDGETLTISCPSKTSVAVLSAFYGRHVPSENLCPARNANITEEDTDCMSPVAVQVMRTAPLLEDANPKVADECQERRTCHIPVINHVFGLDPCPGTSKYLILFPLALENHRSKLVCENERLRLACRNDTVLAIYSATFGHQLHGSPRCPQEPTGAPDIECLSPSALRRVSRRCHGRTNCSLVADTQGFGDPCFPGVRKQLRVSFTCGVPEKVALYFVSGICSGLVFLLCLFGLKSTVTRDIKGLFSDLRDELKATQEPHPELTEDDDDTASESSFYRLTRSYRMADVFPPDLMVGVEGREQEEDEEPLKELPSSHIWPHRDSSPYAVHKLKSSSA
ncbi:hypothetical protein Z043_125484 [Scleropages formosus]|uniref:SUEL-type lectin domain-containing protein n=1 Tax=Scleropages formosus TaxID=113540 RepID=A0A0N8JV13_SCLFO|nr:hypothetical protein Z043_125484 [Scleropages formosus]